MKPMLIEYHERQRDLTAKMPKKLDLVEEDIRNHRNYEKLEKRMKEDFEGILAVNSFERKRRHDNNKDLRSIWSHLYHGKEYKPV
jgi:hypothetical protein